MDNNVIKQLLTEASATLRALSAQKTKLASELATMKKREEAKYIVQELEKRGHYSSSESLDDRVDALLNSGKDLGVIKEALAFTPKDLPFASVAKSNDKNEGSKDALVDYLLFDEDSDN